jgi:hypothetical protein
MSLLASTRSILALAAIAIAALVIPTAALAKGPVISENNDTTPQTITEWADCPTYTIDATYMADRRNQDYYDANGNLVLERRHIDFSGVLYNDSDPSKSVPYAGHFDLVFDFVAGTVANTGLVTHVIVPGQGVINLTAGLFLGGPDFVVEHGPSGDVTQLCTYLG